MSRTLFWFRCIRSTWVTDDTHPTSIYHHFHLSICPPVQRIDAKCRHQEGQLPSRWHLLQIARQPGASSGVPSGRYEIGLMERLKISLKQQVTDCTVSHSRRQSWRKFLLSVPKHDDIILRFFYLLRLPAHDTDQAGKIVAGLNSPDVLRCGDDGPT